MGMTSKIVTEEDKKDYGMLRAMQEGTQDDLVSEEEIFKALKEK